MDEQQHEFGLFKYRIISPVLNESGLEQMKYFREMAGKKHDLENSSRTSFSPFTFKKWLAVYRKKGFEGLCSSGRKDRGIFRSISEELKEKIQSLTAEFDFRTVRNLYNYLIREKIIEKDQFTYATLNNFVRKHRLLYQDGTQKPRKAYETESVNRLWVCDFMYGPHVWAGKQKTTAYLCAIIDDHSRLIVSSGFYDNQSIVALEETLKRGFLTYGIPDRFYCDNGKVFSGNYLQLVSARLGFTLIHSKPYDAPSRGKIERFYRTVRDCFLPDFMIRNKDNRITLELINEAFKTWIFQGYNSRRHSAIDETPIDRYMRSMEQIKVRKTDQAKIREVFMHTIHRSVNNDATISFRGRLYQVPALFIGRKKVELRYDPEDMELFVYENNARVAAVRLLDKRENAKFPVHFNKDDPDMYPSLPQQKQEARHG